MHDGTGPPWLHVVGAAAGDVPAAFPIWVIDDGDDAEKYVEPQRDQTVADVARAVGGGLTSAEHVKRATYIGTTIDQGRTSGVLTAEVVNRLLGWAPGAQGPTNARPPYTPVPFSALAGIDGGPTLLDPIRVTPIHDWHEAHGAVYENVGQWKRPRYFPVDDEDMDAAVARECRAVRTGVGVLDASTLGKIDVCGPDAGVFLDRMYTNRMSNLAVGSIRYGLMLGLDGMVFDDGVAMRLAEDRYVVTTTTGGAAAVMDRFEEWLQTEWTDLRVYCTSVTEQWSVVAVGGPKAREVVAAAGTDIDLDNEAFAFMRFRDGTVADVPVADVPDQFHGRALLRAARLAVARAARLGIGDGRRRAVRHHALRHRGDARAARREGLRDRRAGDRRHADARGPRDGLDREPGQGRLRRQALAGAQRHRARGPQAPRRSAHRGSRRSYWRRERRSSRQRRSRRRRRTCWAGSPRRTRARPRARASRWRWSSADASAAASTVHAVLDGRTMPCTVTDPIFYDVEGARRDG